MSTTHRIRLVGSNGVPLFAGVIRADEINEHFLDADELSNADYVHDVVLPFAVPPVEGRTKKQRAANARKETFQHLILLLEAFRFIGHRTEWKVTAAHLKSKLMSGEILDVFGKHDVSASLVCRWFNRWVVEFASCKAYAKARANPLENDRVVLVVPGFMFHDEHPLVNAIRLAYVLTQTTPPDSRGDWLLYVLDEHNAEQKRILEEEMRNFHVLKKIATAREYPSVFAVMSPYDEAEEDVPTMNLRNSRDVSQFSDRGS